MSRGSRRLPVLVAAGLLPILLAWGVWRIARDHPLWLAPALWSVSAPRVGPVALPRLVLAFHYPWYGTPGGPTARWRHWDHPRELVPSRRILGFHDPRRLVAPGRLDIGATHYPARGPYDSRDPAVIRDQLAAAEAAGLDGFIVSWWGRESEEAFTFAHLLQAARGRPFRVGAYYEAGELWPRGTAGVAADLQALLDRHGADPALLRVEGAPVIFLYGAHRIPGAGWDHIRRRLARRGHRVWLVASESRRRGWLDAFDALHVYTPVDWQARRADREHPAAAAREARIPFLPAVSPGFDDRTIRTPGTVVDRAGGATYAATWRAALASDPPWVLISTWNEWHEGSEIEPSREHGTRYLEATRRWADAFRARRR